MNAMRVLPNLNDAAKRAAWMSAIDTAAASVSAATRDTATSVLFREVMAQLMAANDATVALPEEVVLHEFGEGAMGVLSRQFEDNYSSMIWPEALRRFRQQVDGNFVGVGIMIRHDEKRDIQVINPLEGSPASRAGLKPDDRIIAVDGKSTTGWALNKAVDLITGPEGDVVTLTIRRANVPEPFDVAMKRESIKIRSVNGWNKFDRKWQSNLGVVCGSRFGNCLCALDKFQRGQLRGFLGGIERDAHGAQTEWTDFGFAWQPRRTSFIGR